MCPASLYEYECRAIVDVSPRGFGPLETACTSTQTRLKIIRNEMCFVINQDEDVSL